MNNERKPADILWYAHEQHGRQSPPRGSKYMPVLHSIPERPGEGWSVVIEPLQENHDPMRSEGWVGFLAPEAPWEMISSSNTFEVYEGRWPVARINIR